MEGFVINGSVMNVVCCEWVCYERVCYVMNMVCYERGLL